ncbi:unnamed protein product [Rodentolepis nana]|uniref:Uncharacterized protein n=1 Tax=Rodentolepis nana TaxID=102285 RepID=A0A0R3THY7_RODNA|nr:unnamed protein product [Rodentolepis nana]
MPCYYRAEQFICSLKETDQSIRDFEFDCHQAAQLFFHETNETRFQIRGFLLDYENDIKLLAPYSPFVASALQILPLIHAEMAPTMHSAGIYDHYNERGKKMRRTVQNLPKEYNDFKVSIENLSTALFHNPNICDPEAILDLYQKCYANCFLFVQENCSDVEDAVKVFFHLRRKIRRHLDRPDDDVVSDNYSCSDYSYESFSSLSQLSDFEEPF